MRAAGARRNLLRAEEAILRRVRERVRNGYRERGVDRTNTVLETLSLPRLRVHMARRGSLAPYRAPAH